MHLSVGKASDVMLRYLTTHGNNAEATVMDSLHEQAVRLWVQQELQGDHPAVGSAITFTLLDKLPPDGVEPRTPVEICELLNSLRGLPPLTHDDKLRIQAMESALTVESRRRMLIRGVPITYYLDPVIRYSAYVLALSSLLIAGWSWGVVTLAVMTWWSRGAMTMGFQKQRVEGGPSWEMPAHLFIYWGFLLACFIYSLVHILSRNE